VFVRVVRFTGVDPSRLEEARSRVEEGEGPPPGIKARKLQILLDSEQGSAVVLQYFDSAEDMAASEEALSGMDPSETPGTRASVDRCELKLEFDL
jgi:hypothetical protein